MTSGLIGGLSLLYRSITTFPRKAEDPPGGTAGWSAHQEATSVRELEAGPPRGVRRYFLSIQTHSFHAGGLLITDAP